MDGITADAITCFWRNLGNGMDKRIVEYLIQEAKQAGREEQELKINQMNQSILNLEKQNRRLKNVMKLIRDSFGLNDEYYRNIAKNTLRAMK